MYAARPEILQRTGEDELNSQYFTQTLLKDYLEYRNPSWKVVWDARGHIIEPHTDKEVGLGGSAVLEYQGKWTKEIIDMDLPEIHERVQTVGPATASTTSCLSRRRASLKSCKMPRFQSAIPWPL